MLLSTNIPVIEIIYMVPSLIDGPPFHYFIHLFILLPLGIECKWPQPQDTPCLEGLQLGRGRAEDQKRVVREEIN